MDIDQQLHDAISERIALGQTATEITAQLTEAGYDAAEATQLYEAVRATQDTDVAAPDTAAESTAEAAPPSGTRTALIVAGIVLVVVTVLFVAAYLTLDLGALLRNFQ